MGRVHLNILLSCIRVGDPNMDITRQGNPTCTFSVYRKENLNLSIMNVCICAFVSVSVTRWCYVVDYTFGWFKVEALKWECVNGIGLAFSNKIKVQQHVRFVCDYAMLTEWYSSEAAH